LVGLVSTASNFAPLTSPESCCLAKSDATQLRTTDSILLAILAVGTAAFTIWVDVI
jgi:hypothetical protein